MRALSNAWWRDPPALITYCLNETRFGATGKEPIDQLHKIGKNCHDMCWNFERGKYVRSLRGSRVPLRVSAHNTQTRTPAVSNDCLGCCMKYHQQVLPARLS